MLDVITDNLDIWTTAQKQKKAVGRGKAKKEEAYGIKKLRELILELAVRGKLVPQDPNDEPASVLLEKIAGEKQRLIDEGKIKKQKALPEIGEDEKPFEIPRGWEWSRLGVIGDIFNGNSISVKVKEEKYTDLTNGLPYIATKDIGYGWTALDYKNGIIIPKGEPKFKVAKKGAVLICSEGGSAGKKCGITNHDICFGNKLFAINLFGGIKSELILSNYLSPTFVDAFKEKMTGIIGGISTSKFIQLLVPLPPLAEQHRIVAKVDELMALCDQLEQEQADHQATHQTLVKTLLNGLILRYGSLRYGSLRQAQGERSYSDCPELVEGHVRSNTVHPELVVRQAHHVRSSTVHPELVEGSIVEGSIVEGSALSPVSSELFEEHFDTLFTTEDSIDQLKQTILQLAVMGKLVPQNPKDEPASVLLEKIAQEKAKLIKEGKIKKQKALPEITEDEKPFGLPDGWEWASLSHLGVFSGGKTPSKAKSIYWDGDIAWVTPKDMKVKHIIGSQDHVTQKAIDDGLALYSKEAILFVVRSGILRHSFPVAVTKIQCTVNQDLKVLSLFNTNISSYVQLMMKGFEQYILNNLTKSGMTVESIVFDKFSTHYFIFPPLAEQHRIVTKVNQLLSLCDTLKANLNQAQTTQTQLADTIVKQAVN